MSKLCWDNAQQQHNKSELKPNTGITLGHQVLLEIRGCWPRKQDALFPTSSGDKGEAGAGLPPRTVCWEVWGAGKELTHWDGKQDVQSFSTVMVHSRLSICQHSFIALSFTVIFNSKSIQEMKRKTIKGQRRPGPGEILAYWVSEKSNSSE